MLPDERVKAGETVVTSGGDQVFPRGLPVGVVDRVVPDTSNPPYVDIVIKPAANLGHLEEVLVITAVSDHLTKKAQQDLAQSAADAAAMSKQRASDILAERLPGLNDPDAVADANGQVKTPAASAAPAAPPPLHPPATLHPDHFSPSATAPASALTPGQAVTDPKYPPAPKVQAPASKPTSSPEHARVGAATDTEAPAPVKPKRAATPATTADDGANSATPPAPKPKTPKVPVPEHPAGTGPAPETNTEPPSTKPPRTVPAPSTGDTNQPQQP
jgi:rod shape-determining protein MreC